MSMGVCPCCNKMNLDYGAVDFYDDQCYFPRECKSCGATGEEWYSMEFIGHENVVDNRLVETFKTGEKQEKLKSLIEEINNAYGEIDESMFHKYMLEKICNCWNVKTNDAEQIYWDCCFKS